MAKQRRYRATFQHPDGNMYVTLYAADRDEAEKFAKEYQARREARFPLTFARLEASAETGQLDGMLAVSPGVQRAIEAGQDPSVFIAVETERRKRDQDRYADSKMKLMSVEEDDR